MPEGLSQVGVVNGDEVDVKGAIALWQAEENVLTVVILQRILPVNNFRKLSTARTIPSIADDGCLHLALNVVGELTDPNVEVSV